MTYWRSGDVVANGVKLNYYRTGGDKPPLVMLHGVTSDALGWTVVARALESDYDIIAYDARGHGLSEATEEGYDSNTRAADAVGLIRALGLEQPGIVGHSMGADTAITVAAEYPDLVRYAILEDPPSWISDDQAARELISTRAAEWRSNLERYKTMSRDELVALCRAENPTWSEDALGPWADSKLRVSMYVLGLFKPGALCNWRELAPRITCPVLLVTADPKLGGIVTPQVAAEFMRLIPSCRVANLPGAGHNIHREQSTNFVGSVREFLATIQ